MSHYHLMDEAYLQEYVWMYNLGCLASSGKYANELSHRFWRENSEFLPSHQRLEKLCYQQTIGY